MQDTRFAAPTRRGFLGASALGAASLWTPGVLAEALTRTPQSRMFEGPFYPDEMPLDTDNDLLLINDSISPAVGEITHLTGRLMSNTGAPIRNAFIEIWQVDNTASYIHSRGRNPDGNDSNFQGYGRFLTGSDGRYYFRTIKPVSYRLMGIFRTPHIHFAISKNGQRIFTSQMFVNGHPDNARDGLVKTIRDAKAKETVLVDFKPIEGSPIGELAANFDIVLGQTVEELEDGSLAWGLGESGMMGGFFGRRRLGPKAD